MNYFNGGFARRLASYVALFVLGFSGGVFLQHSPDCGNIFTTRDITRHELAQRQTVLVVSGRAQGSGVVVSRANETGKRFFVWTAAHVVKDSYDVTIKQIIRHEGRKSGEIVFTGQVLFSDSQLDVALIWLHCPPGIFTGIEFASPEVSQINTPVFHVGNWFGAGFDGSFSKGVISQIGVKPDFLGWDWPLLDQAALVATPGSSGGGIFRESDGKVLGLVVAGPGPWGFVCYVPVRLFESHSVFHYAAWGDTCPADSTLQSAVASHRSEIEAERARHQEEIESVIGP